MFTLKNIVETHAINFTIRQCKSVVIAGGFAQQQYVCFIPNFNCWAQANEINTIRLLALN